ncbi:unnamed protein product [Boreogadus saida]
MYLEWVESESALKERGQSRSRGEERGHQASPISQSRSTGEERGHQASPISQSRSRGEERGHQASSANHGSQERNILWNRPVVLLDWSVNRPVHQDHWSGTSPSGPLVWNQSIRTTDQWSLWTGSRPVVLMDWSVNRPVHQDHWSVSGTDQSIRTTGLEPVHKDHWSVSGTGETPGGG